MRNAASLIPQLAITCSENVHALPCIDLRGRIDRDNNTTPAIYALEPPFFWVKEQNCLIGYIRGNEAHESEFPKLHALTIIEKSRPELDQNEHVYAIFCRPEVASDVISGASVKTVECYAVLIFFSC